MAANIEPLLTVTDLDACPDDNNRYELIGEELFVSYTATISHQLVLQALQMNLARHIDRDPIGIVVPGVGAYFSDYDAVIPDLVFVRHERWDSIVADEKFIGAPDLVIEVLSPGPENEKRDLVVKRQLYAQYGVQEYWIVDPQTRSVHVYRLHGRSLEDAMVLTGDDEITSPILPGFELALSLIFKT
jgi:Uma2 family endonuclease